jgi:hypothetical protein
MPHRLSYNMEAGKFRRDDTQLLREADPILHDLP